MFWHHFKYTLKVLFRNKALIFWTFAFPLILGTFFKMAFSNIESSEMLDIIDIAIINNEEFNKNETMKEVFQTLSEEGSEDQLFSTVYVNVEEAKKLLEEKKISGYLLLEQEPKIIINSSGINETVLKGVVDEILQTQKLMEEVGSKLTIEEATNKVNNQEIPNYDVIKQEVYLRINRMLEENNISIKNISNQNLGYVTIEFYTLIAMTCLYSGIIGMTAINNLMANMSKKGSRISVSSNSKMNLILSSTLASFFVQLLGILILFLFTIFVLKVDYGSLPLVIILTIVGSFAGLCMGIAISCLLKVGENAKIGIIIAISMFCCFLSGMMGITMKYIVDKNIPLLNKINPGNMITDGLYSLYYYDTYHRYIFNIVSLIIFSIILLIISSRSLRRRQYDHI